MTNKNNQTIKIAGAGISGLTSAIVLAKAGYKVKIYEKNNQVGERFNEDFQGLMNWGFDKDVFDFTKSIGLEINFWNKPLTCLDVFGPGNHKQTFNLDAPIIYLVQRGIKRQAFDQSLKQQAIKCGVEIIFNTIKEKGEVDIIATGPNFDGVTDGMTLGYTFESDSPDIFVSIFNNNLAYKGYSYFFIVDGYGTIATCIFGNFNKISQYFDRTYALLQKHYSFNMKCQKKFSGTGNFYLLNSDKIYIGEAGGFQDFLWGFGMRYAIITGNLAARSIIENKSYKELWKKELSGLLKTSIVNRLFFSLPGKYSYKYFIRMLNKYDDPKEFLTKVYRPNIFSKIFYPIAKIYFSKYVKDRSSKI